MNKACEATVAPIAGSLVGGTIIALRGSVLCDNSENHMAALRGTEQRAVRHA